MMSSMKEFLTSCFRGGYSPVSNEEDSSLQTSPNTDSKTPNGTKSTAMQTLTVLPTDAKSVIVVPTETFQWDVEMKKVAQLKDKYVSERATSTPEENRNKFNVLATTVKTLAAQHRYESDKCELPPLDLDMQQMAIGGNFSSAEKQAEYAAWLKKKEEYNEKSNKQLSNYKATIAQLQNFVDIEQGKLIPPAATKCSIFSCCFPLFSSPPKLDLGGEELAAPTASTTVVVPSASVAYSAAATLSNGSNGYPHRHAHGSPTT